MRNNNIIDDINSYLNICSMIGMSTLKCKSLHGEVYIIYKDEDNIEEIIYSNNVYNDIKELHIANKVYKNIKDVFIVNNICERFNDVLNCYIVGKEVLFVINNVAFKISDLQLSELRELIKEDISDNTTFEKVQKLFNSNMPLLLGTVKEDDTFINLIEYNSNIYKVKLFGRSHCSKKQLIVTMDDQIYLSCYNGYIYKIELNNTDKKHLKISESCGIITGYSVNNDILVFDDIIIDTKTQQIIVSDSGIWNEYVRDGYILSTYLDCMDEDSHIVCAMYNTVTKKCCNKLSEMSEIIETSLKQERAVKFKIKPDKEIFKCNYKCKKLSKEELMTALSNSVI